MQPPDSAPHRLLVEGKDDLHTIIHLMLRHGVNWESWSDDNKAIPYVHDCKSYSKLSDVVAVSAKSHRRLGVIFDANSNPPSRWNQIRDRLSRENISIPDSPDPNGIIIDGSLPGSKIGIWMMPNNNLQGAIEDMLITLIPGNDCCWAYAEEATNEAKSKGARFRENDFIKARLHTWLA
ncbi:MAG: hypothetical protein JXD22_03120 [Sedimentisphaerales bacterium]|nr:hypothetical protein [Sedimentisphaerales bacterium]